MVFSLLFMLVSLMIQAMVWSVRLTVMLLRACVAMVYTISAARRR